MGKKLRCIKIAGRAIPLGLIAVLLISGIGLSLLAYFWPSVTIPFEVKEPLEILSYPSGFSLFPGETVEFNVTVKNHAPINYSVVLDYQLDDSHYQTNYVRFSNETYNVMPGENLLTAWASIEPCAPPAETDLTITLERICPHADMDDSGFVTPITIVIESTAYGDPYARFHALTFDNPIPEVFWKGDWHEENPDAIIGVSSRHFQYEETVNLPPGQHVLEYVVSAYVGYWYTTIRINGVIVSSGDVTVHDHLKASFEVFHTQ